MKRTKNFRLSLLAISFQVLPLLNLSTQTVIHNSDFLESQGNQFSISGNIGNSPWQIIRSGDDWGARIDNEILELTNTASNEDNQNGWIFTFLKTDNFNQPYQKILKNNIEKISWYFNIRQIRTNPAGFNPNNYGVAYIIGSTEKNVANEGSGYAVVLGNSGTPDPIRFIKFDNGIQSIGTSSDGLIEAEAPLEDPKNEHLSIKLTYNPNNNKWKFFGRNDGGSFEDPSTGELYPLGSAIDDEYTNIKLNYTGAYWQGSTAANQTAFFDNISIWSKHEGLIPPAITNVIQEPSYEISSDTIVYVYAEVSEGDAPVKHVELKWGLEENELNNSITMLPDNENIYITNTAIPEHENNTTVYYQVFAEDENDISITSNIFNYEVNDPEEIFIITNIENFESENVDYATAFEDLELPETAEVTLDNNDIKNLEVIWQKGNYDPFTPGNYNLTGELILAENIENPDNITANIKITVNEEDDGKMLIAGWTFYEESRKANKGIPENIDNLISREESFKGEYSYFAGIENDAISTNNWENGENLKYWVIELSTLYYKDLTISSSQRSSSTAPKDFKLQYKIGDDNWTDIENGDIEVENNFTTGNVKELSLPSEVENKTKAYIRWIMNSNVSVGGSDVQSTGNSRIDNIFIKGLYDDNFTRIISGVKDPLPIYAETGTSFEELPLPEKIIVYYEDLGSEKLNVLWSESQYDATYMGIQSIEGEILTNDNIDNPNNIIATIEIDLLEEINHITSVQKFDPVKTFPGIEFNELGIPGKAEVTLCNDSTIILDINWLSDNYDPETINEYNIEGELELEYGINNPDSLKVAIIINVSEPDIIAGWTFPEESREANFGASNNIGKLVSREDSFNGNYTYESGVIDNHSLATTNWSDGEGKKYWIVEFATTKHENLKLSSAQFSTPAGPRDFKLQYKLAGQNWEYIEDLEISTDNSFNKGVLKRIALPKILNNKPSVLLRWIMNSNTSINENEVTTGRSQIDNILVEGFFNKNIYNAITEVEDFEYIEVPKGTSFDELSLPDNIKITLDDKTEIILDVNWNKGNYDPNNTGITSIFGEIILIEGVKNPDNIIAEIDIKITPSNSINILSSNNINIYPNPAKDYVNIKSSDIIEYIELINNYGVIVTKKPINEYYYQLKLGQTPKGYYFLKINTLKGVITTKKIIIN